MGMFMPEKYETHRLVLELPGGGRLTQRKYEQYKKAIESVAKRYGVKITAREFVVTKRKPAK